MNQIRPTRDKRNRSPPAARERSPSERTEAETIGTSSKSKGDDFDAQFRDTRHTTTNKESILTDVSPYELHSVMMRIETGSRRETT